MWLSLFYYSYRYEVRDIRRASLFGERVTLRRAGYSNYNKIENGIREISVKEIQRLANFYNLTVDQILNFDNDIPKEVVIEDKQANEQLRLISQLDKDDKAIIFKMIDKMLTSKKFKDFFNKNVSSL